MWNRVFLALSAAFVCLSADGAAAQPVFTTPASPWQPYRETNDDPTIGPAYAAYRLDGMPPQQLIAYRLFTAAIAENTFGEYIEDGYRQTYPDATFSNVEPVALCNGMRGASFRYTADFGHDGHPSVTQEVVVQGTALYALVYRRAASQQDDPQALDALRSLCPPKNEPLQPPPPFELGDQFGRFSPPAAFSKIDGQTPTSIGWVRPGDGEKSVVGLYHQPTLYSSIADFGALQRQLAETKAATLDGFQHYALLVNRPAPACAGDSTPRWYTEIRGDYHGTPAVAKQMYFIQNRTLYSAGYIRPADAADDTNATSSVLSLCPRPGDAARPAAITTGDGGVIGGKAPVVIAGRTFSDQDMGAFYTMIFRQSGEGSKAQIVWKAAAEMPDYAPDFCYGGTEAGRAVYWERRGADIEQQQRQHDARFEANMRREGLASMIAAGLDAGQGGAAIQALVQKRTPASLMQLAFASIDGMENASRQTVANSLATQDWVARNITHGLTRERVVAELSAKSITAKPELRTLVNCSNDIEENWWYQADYPQNECGLPSAARPVIRVKLDGPFQPGCSFSTNLDVIFDADDRVERLAITQPIPNCL